MAGKHIFPIFAVIFLVVGVAPRGVASTPRGFPDGLKRGVNGGVSCATCTVIVALVEQLGEIYNETVTKSFDRLCQYLPADYRGLCKAFGETIVPFIIEGLEARETPDVVCHAIGLCFTQAGKRECAAFPPPKGGVKSRLSKISKRDTTLVHRADPQADICDLPGIKEICVWVKDIFDKHDPALDADGDLHSTTQTLRGVSWRGKDCDDTNPNIHPGAKPLNSDVYTDSNCNGIYGVDGASGTPYEDLLCKDTPSLGVAILGDSVGAHFHLPEEWFDSRQLSLDAFKDLTFILENEIDWPELSSTTGYKNSTYSVTKGPTHSIYHSLWQWNRCNHRDYQNIAVNGARSSSILSRIVPSLSRKPETDQPLLVIYAVVGNDVCNGHPDTFAHMTTPEEMRQNFQKTLEYLDSHLPAGSHVFVNGLVDGRVLFDSLHDRIHPIGRLHNDVTYTQIYDFLGCLEVSPCIGWLNSNETVRNMTTERAELLNSVLNNISQTYQSKVFDIHYLDFPIKEAIKRWAANGGETWQLIEPVDGFHTNQNGQALTAQVLWEYLRTKLPHLIGPENPKNSQIEALFGNQGGYE